MLGKLMKYEFRATGRVFLPLFAALIIISVVNRLLMNLGLRTPSAISTTLTVILIVGIGVIAFVLTMQRFRNNLLSSEGYLMMTLPTKVENLILSKLFVSTIWFIVSSIVVAAAILTMALTDISFSFLGDAVRYVIENLDITTGQFVIYAIEAFIMAIIGLFSGILMIYTCMSLSMLVNKRRGLFSFGAFIVISTVLQTITSVIFSIGITTNLFDAIGRTFRNISGFGKSQVVILFMFLLEAILCAVYFIISRQMLKNRLNLQ